MMDRQVLIHETTGALYKEAARRFASAASEAVAARGRCFVALSGGSTPRPLYELLAEPGWRDRVPWRQVHLFWGDERFVPPDDPRSNRGMAQAALLSRVEIPPGNVHPVPTDAGPPERVAALYEALVRRVVTGDRADTTPVFDLALLGLGEDGHTASLFPHSPVLHAAQALVAPVFMNEAGVPRITMTAPLLNAARLQLFLVAGASKAAVLGDVLSERSAAERLPASLLAPAHGTQVWLVERSAWGVEAPGRRGARGD